jgi:hypothetical protein
MHERTSGSRAARRSITVAATALAVLIVVVSSLLLGGSGATRATAPASDSPNFEPFVLPTTTIDLNRSQSAGIYVPEYVALNNSTTLTKLPAALTVTAGTCKWVTVQNLTSAASPATVFHNVEYANETAANESGTLLSHSSSFKVCGGAGVWINFVYWTFGVYVFDGTGLAVTPAPKVVYVTYGDWPGVSAGPAPAMYPFSSTSDLSLTVASNLSFEVTFSRYNTSTSCDVTGQVCAYTTYTFVSASSGASVNTTATLIFGTIAGVTGYAKANSAYSNWTIGYTSATVNANTGLGGFFEDTSSFFSEVFVQFWYLWILVLLVVIVIALMGRDRRGRR